MNKPLRIVSSLMIATGCALAGSVSADFKVTNPSTPVRVLVQFDSAPAVALMTQLGWSGAVAQKKFKHLPKTMTFTVPAGAVKFIAGIPGVKYITPDRTIKKRMDLTASTVGSGLAFQSGLTGQGIGVAVIDSGI